ncbi:hypothetical protein CI15_26365 [Paraburkholderia monticola]|uniref:Uncharacterized protein n=1 Tax=Paraburkholderia monticola TaxID=1399968 RepID=A0A149PG70_9BURK|nr:hypothetical protein [Paraburkholderia monticola]KXU84033.1 hypothetical protein CI15_26365 [Paraburkholderia monticola]
MNASELQKLGHALDAGWLMALWLAIHGGDPPPQEQVIGENESLDLSALALVARLSELYPEADKTPGAALANLAKLGFKVTVTMADDSKVQLHGPDDVKALMATMSAAGANQQGPYKRICIWNQYLGQVCKILYQTHWS